jgi:hypothetical protein
MTQLTTEQRKLLEEYTRRFGKKFPFDSMADMFTSPLGMGITSATPTQIAICNILEGRKCEGIVAEAAQKILGIDSEVPSVRPDEAIIMAGIRTGKSMIAALAAVWASQHVDVSHLSAGEIPRVALTSLRLDNANVILGHLIGLLSRPALRHLVIDPAEDEVWGEILRDTAKDTNGSRFVRHPSGRPIELCVLAGARAGGSLVSRWVATWIADEVLRWASSNDAVVNYDDQYHAVKGRILPGGQIIGVGSPYGPRGPIYDRVMACHGKPSKDCTVMRARGPDMNPVWWTPERCEDIRRLDPVAYRTDVEAQFADVEEALFPAVTIERATRKSPLTIPYDPRCQYAAAIDPATRGNSFTLVIASKNLINKKTIVYNNQWTGSTIDPLNPTEVLKEVAEVLKEYHLGWCYTDQWSADALKQLALTVGLTLVQEDWNAKNRVDCFLSLASAMANGDIELPPDPVVADDLKQVYRTATVKGPSIVLPPSRDGRHSDYAPALARVLKRWLDEPKTLDIPRIGTVEYTEYVEKKSVEKLIKEGNKRAPFWETDVGLKTK